MQTPNGSTVQGYDSFASLLSQSRHGEALRRAGATQDVAVVSESQRAPEVTVESTGPRGPKM